jgi:hypothetical protein
MAEKRKSLSRAARFKVFNRDGFTCQYCGQQPPRVVLEVDHIVPVSGGGSNHVENLTTACFDCNRGKAARGLEAPAPMAAEEKLEMIRERELQIKELKRVMNKVQTRVSSEIKSINLIYENKFFAYHLSQAFLDGSVRMFLERLPFHEVEEAMRLACLRIVDPAKAPKYFCGICWNKIKGGQG